MSEANEVDGVVMCVVGNADQIKHLLEVLDRVECEVVGTIEKPFVLTAPPEPIIERPVFVEKPIWPGTMKRKKGGFKRYT